MSGLVGLSDVCLPCVVPSQLNINVVAIFPVRSARLEGKPYEVVGILTLDQFFKNLPFIRDKCYNYGDGNEYEK